MHLSWSGEEGKKWDGEKQQRWHPDGEVKSASGPFFSIMLQAFIECLLDARHWAGAGGIRVKLTVGILR